jgi:tocopherol cyclase
MRAVEGEPLWTPHSGYHWNGGSQRFFEGWYFRLTLPDLGQSFAFMYSIDDPGGQTDLSGGAAQILGPNDHYLYCPLPNVEGFWAWPHRLGLGHLGKTNQAQAKPQYLAPGVFNEQVTQGYQVTATHHQGCVQDRETGAIARWSYAIQPRYGWGPRQGPQRPTAGWLSYLPIFEPGWQVLMAHGWASGWMEWQGQRYDFEAVPTYGEKNWGGAFPQKWFWIQANCFVDHPDLTLTAAGGRRQVLEKLETVGLIGMHHQGDFIDLSSLNAQLCWQVSPWGNWQMAAQNHRYRIVLQGATQLASAPVRVPTREGLQWRCWDTTRGQLTVQLWQQKTTLTPEQLLIEAQTNLAGLEVGGLGWDIPWHHTELWTKKELDRLSIGRFSTASGYREMLGLKIFKLFHQHQVRKPSLLGNFTMGRCLQGFPRLHLPLGQHRKFLRPCAHHSNVGLAFCLPNHHAPCGNLNRQSGLEVVPAWVNLNHQFSD